MRKLGCLNPEEFAASAVVAGLEDSSNHVRDERRRCSTTP
jgi:hypothetical protein